MNYISVFVTQNLKPVSYTNLTHDHTFSRMQTDRDYDFSNDALCLSYSNDRFSLLKCAHQAFWVDQKSDSIRLLFELEKDELITSMSYDNNRMIWTSTNKGLGFFDLESQKYHRIRTRLFNGISYLIADGKGRLWICAQNHLYSYIIKENRFIPVSYTHLHISFGFAWRRSKRSVPSMHPIRFANRSFGKADSENLSVENCPNMRWQIITFRIIVKLCIYFLYS